MSYSRIAGSTDKRKYALIFIIFLYDSIYRFTILKHIRSQNVPNIHFEILF